MPVFGVAGYDRNGNEAKLIVEKKPDGNIIFRILIFDNDTVMYDVEVGLESERVGRLVKFLMG